MKIITHFSRMLGRDSGYWDPDNGSVDHVQDEDTGYTACGVLIRPVDGNWQTSQYKVPTCKNCRRKLSLPPLEK